MTKHTPAPWASGHEISSRARQIFDRNGRQIGIVDTPDNAAFIVLAVNNHKDLVEALEAAIKQIKSSKEFNAPIKQSFGVKNLVENNLKKALAAAKGDA